MANEIETKVQFKRTKTWRNQFAAALHAAEQLPEGPWRQLNIDALASIIHDLDDQLADYRARKRAEKAKAE